jgi:hypothetical protein
MSRSPHSKFVRLTVAALTVALLITAAAWSRMAAQRQRDSAWATSPDGCLAQLTRVSQAGDVPAYVECFAGSLRDEIEHQRRAAGSDEAFASQLRESVVNLKGVATYEERPSTSSDAQLMLERIYQRHNERYRIALRADSGSWRVVDMTRVGAELPPVEYGTPVFALDPEGGFGETKATTN